MTRPPPIRRLYAGLDHDPWEPIETIRSLLADVYRYDPDGRTIVRELVQNADDASANELVFIVVHEGFPEASNTLLHGPALVVINDGPFPEEDHDGLHVAIGGAKRGDASKVGRFGLGLKSVFHLCEAFLYVGRDHGDEQDRIGCLNPWAGTDPSAVDPVDPNVGRDPLHPDWDLLDDGDYGRLRALGTRCVPAFDRRGLLLWIPLRRHHEDARLSHTNRGEDRDHEYGISDRKIRPHDLLRWFDHADAKHLLLAQAGALHTIRVLKIARAGSDAPPEVLRTLERPTFQSRSWLDRPKVNESPRAHPARSFNGEIVADAAGWRVVGRDVWDDASLQALRASRSRDWPRDWIRLPGGRSREQDRKAVGHAGVTVVRPIDGVAGPGAIRLRWCVFFPLDDTPLPASGSALIDVHRGVDPEGPAWDVLLHGYFWPAQDRRSIPGVAEMGDHRADTAADDLRVALNHAIRDGLLLPLLPSALRNACEGLPQLWANCLVQAVSSTQLWDANASATVTRDELLLPVLEAERVAWSTLPPSSEVIELRGWSEAPRSVRRSLPDAFRTSFPNTVLISADCARLGGKPREWSGGEVAVLLDLIGAEQLRGGTVQSWVARAVRGSNAHILSPSIASSLAGWLAARLGERALDPTTQEAWAPLFGLLPSAWLVRTPRGARTAVAELGAERLIGPGLMPVPLGLSDAPEDPSGDERPTTVQLRSALAWLGESLETGEGSVGLRQSRLLLAESLLASVVGTDVLAGLEDLPLLRAHRLPEGRDEPWSLRRVRDEFGSSRVFARDPEGRGDQPVEDEDDPPPAAPVRDAKALATALGESVWLVRRGVSRFAEPPLTHREELACALLTGTRPLAGAKERCSLLVHLGRDDDTRQVVRVAVRTLLTGHRGAGDDGALYYVPTAGASREKIHVAAGILLRLLDRSWSLVDAPLVEPLPHSVVQRAQVRPCDIDTLHELLKEALEQPAVDWTRLEDSEARHLIEVLHPQPNDKAANERWRNMPLHQTVGGVRMPLHPCRRSVTGVRLPGELAGEIILLKPDHGLEALYGEVPRLDATEALRIILKSKEPWRFAVEVFALLPRHAGDEIDLPADQEVREQLLRVAWLPLSEPQGSAVAPVDLLLLPGDVENAARPLVDSEALGPARRPGELKESVADFGLAMVRKLPHNGGPAAQVQRLAALIGQRRSAGVDFDSYNLAPRELEPALLAAAARTALINDDAGWRLWGAAALILRSPDGDIAPAATALASALVGSVSSPRQVAILSALAASSPARNSDAGRVHAALLTEFSPLDPTSFRGLSFPTQDGTWRPAIKVARSASGLARRHLLRSDLREAVGLDRRRLREAPLAPDAAPAERRQDDRLRTFFSSWEGRVPREAVGTFLALLGDWPDGGGVEELAQEWLGEAIDVADLRAELVGPHWIPPFPPYVNQPFVTGRNVRAINLAGERFLADADEGESPSLFAIDPEQGEYRPGHTCWDLTLRQPEQGATAEEFLRRLGNAVEWWACSVLRVERARLRAFWSEWGTGSQAALGPVRASILAHLPLTLRQLNVNEHAPLAALLAAAEKAQRRRDQAPAHKAEAAVREERKALDALAAAMTESSDHHKFVLERIRDRITSFGYRASSILLELAQNADDALAQAAEIRGQALPNAARTLIVKVHDVASEDGGDACCTIDVTHYGRAINDTGGAAFPAGADRQWEMDLYFMMLMNLSAKPGEAPGGGSSASTTGRFGLGFKCVHLVSDAPHVVSGFLSFWIAAGLLPEEVAKPNEASLGPVEGYLPTRVRLPLRQDPDSANVLAEVFERFSVARVVLPAFARHLRRVVVEGGPHPGQSSYEAKPLVAGWSIGAQPADLGSSRQWTLLRFSLRDADRSLDFTSLLLGLRDGRLEPLPDTVPFLWNVLPTGEAWNVGYAVNGAVKLDPGRTHVALDDPHTRGVFIGLGEGLGDALVALHDALDRGDPDLLATLGVEREDSAAFRTSLWRTLARGLDMQDQKRAELLKLLHGPGRGLQRWMTERSAVPSLLPPPFAPFLSAFGAEGSVRVEEVTGALATKEVCAALASVDGVRDILQDRPAVGSGVAEILRSIVGRQRCSPFQLQDLLLELVVLWNERLTPERLASLNHLVERSVWARLEKDDCAQWAHDLLAHSAASTWEKLPSLLIPAHGDREEDADQRDEALRAAFAPSSRVVAPEYVSTPPAIEGFRRLRGRFHADARTLAEWVLAAKEQHRGPAMRYLSEGKLGREVLEQLPEIEDRPDWLGDFATVEELLNTEGVERRRALAVLAELFPEQFDTDDDDEDGEDEGDGVARELEPLPHEDATRLICELHDRWSDERYRERQVKDWRNRWYPWSWSDERLRDALLKHPADDSDSQTAWMIMFTLATVQGLGRTQPVQHKGFVEAMMARQLDGRTWWSFLFDRFPDKANHQTWFRFLEGWADARVGGRLKYDHWFTTLPELFAAWRWLPEYRQLILAAPRREHGALDALLRPRIDAEQDRGGSKAPPLPVVRHRWLLAELLRLGVLPASALLTDAAWPYSRRFEQNLRLLGFDGSERRNSSFSAGAAAFVKDLLGPQRDPTFFNCFDKPLVSDEFTHSLEAACRSRGLETPDKEAWDDLGGGWYGDVPDDDDAQGWNE